MAGAISVCSTNVSNNSLLRNVLNTNSNLSEVYGKGEKWNLKKRSAKRLANQILRISSPNSPFKSQTNFKTGISMFCCSDTLDVCEADNGSFSVNRAYRCRSKYCPVCGWRKSVENCNSFGANLPDVYQKYRCGRWLFLTLTVPNIPVTELREMIRQMNAAWVRLMQRKAFKAGNWGWIKSLEVTQEEKRPDFAHPHFHILLYQMPSYFKGKNYLKQTEWQDMWMSALKTNIPCRIDIRVVGGPKKQNKKDDELGGAIVETLKAMSYSLKFEDSKHSDYFLYHFMAQMKGVRMLSSGGCLKSIFADVEPDDLDGSEPLAVDNHLFKYDQFYKYEYSYDLTMDQIDRNKKIQALRP